jgi:hypothetical protein
LKIHIPSKHHLTLKAHQKRFGLKGAMSAIGSVPAIKSETSFPVTAPMVMPKC